MAVDYQYFEYQAYEYLIRLQQVLKEEQEFDSVGSLLDELREEKELLRTRRFRVAVVGEFNRGKSSFINALLGSEILPVDALPMTATLNRITYGAVPRAWISYKDGQREEVRIEELSQYVTKLTGASAKAAAGIEEALVEYPCIFCQNHVDLIDTPGLNDNFEMNAVTLSQLEKIDLAIVTLSPDSPFSDTEAGFMVNLLESEEICQIIVVVTKIDLVRTQKKREQLLSYLREQIPEKTMKKLKESHEEGGEIFQKAERILGNLSLFAVCALDALDARKYNDEELLERSGFAELNEKLPGLILASQNNNAVLRALHTVHRVVSDTQKGVLQKICMECDQKRQELLWAKQNFAKDCYRLAAGEEMRKEVSARLLLIFNDFTLAQTSVTGGNYIRCLSSIRVLDTRVIGQALQEQTQREQARIQELINEELYPMVLDILRKTIGSWHREMTDVAARAIYGKPEPTGSADPAGTGAADEAGKAVDSPGGTGSQSGTGQAAADRKEPAGTLSFVAGSQEVLQAYQELAFGRLTHPDDFFGPLAGARTFRWKIVPVPEPSHLLDEDLIEQVGKAVRESLVSYGEDFYQKTDETLSRVCDCALETAEKLVPALFAAANARLDALKKKETSLRGAGFLDKIKQVDDQAVQLEKLYKASISN